MIDGEVGLLYVSTNQQVADILTKGLSMEKHTQFRDIMGVITISMVAENHKEKRNEGDPKEG